jgi:hypothetical protein
LDFLFEYLLFVSHSHLDDAQAEKNTAKRMQGIMIDRCFIKK